MDLHDETVGLAEVAAAMGREAGWLKANWRRLHRDKGFPHMLPGSDGRFSRQAVRTWIAASGRLPDDHADAGTIVGRARAALHEAMGVGQ